MRPHIDLVAKLVPVDRLTAQQKRRMFQLMCKYYTSIDEETFHSDLNRKDAAILLINPRFQFIEGFSTLKNVAIPLDGKIISGVFSGDTVLEKIYWGNRVLGRAFLKYMFMQKMRRPFKPLYWYLISKGYKTYLLMANNFGDHYPRYERVIPDREQRIMTSVYTAMFGDQYDPSTNVMRFAKSSSCLKGNVADIEPHLLQKHPRIAFFQNANPLWQEGAELCCIAKMTLWMPIYYGTKSVLKLLSRPRRQERKPQLEEPSLSSS